MSKKELKKRTYVHKPGAVCITIHSQDGSPVPKAVLDDAADAVWHIARENSLLINLAEV